MTHRMLEESLEPLVRAAARLLRVQALSAHVLELRFDRGALEIALAGRGLEILLDAAAPLDVDGELLDETDPWWTVIGEPLTAAWSAADTEGRRVALELQFRRADQNPKRIAIEPRANHLEARAL